MSETRRDAIERAIATSPFRQRQTPNLVIARTLGMQPFVARGVAAVERLCVASPRAAPVRITERPAGAGAGALLAMPSDDGYRLDGTRGCADGGAVEHRPLRGGNRPVGTTAATVRRCVILDPRVPGQRLDSALGSRSASHPRKQRWLNTLRELMARRAVLPDVSSAVELFRRTDADRPWLGRQLDRATEPAAVSSATRPQPTATSATPTAPRCISPTSAADR